MRCEYFKDKICTAKNVPCEVVQDCPKYHDLSLEELARRAGSWIAQGQTIWIKFTCYHCGARQTSDTPNVLHSGGYTCEECGKVSHPKRWGFVLGVTVR